MFPTSTPCRPFLREPLLLPLLVAERMSCSYALAYAALSDPAEKGCLLPKALQVLQDA